MKAPQFSIYSDAMTFCRWTV